MPLFMDVHHIKGGVSVTDVAKAHMEDVKSQEKYGVNYLRYWVAEGSGRIFCLVDAPDADAANTVHREAHGLVADAIYEVQEGS
jgi:hypothetical protein